MSESVNVFPVLYSFRRCPFAIRARMALACSGIEAELREVKLSDKPAEMVAISSKATVPVLQLPNGRVIDESLEIMLWALQTHDPHQWLIEDQDALLIENDEVFKPLLDQYKYADRFPEKTSMQHRNETFPFVEMLDTRLHRQPYLYGKSPSLIDAAILPFIRQYAGVDSAWFEHCELASLRNWMKSLLQTSLFEAVMKKYAFWQPGDAPVYF